MLRAYQSNNESLIQERSVGNPSS